MSGQATLTQGDAVLGTPSDMAPEQAIGQPADHRADLHALVAVLYRACTGFVPFTGENSQAVLYSVVYKMPLPPSERADLPESLDNFFAKGFARGFAKEPDERYQSGKKELSAALRLDAMEGLARGESLAWANFLFAALEKEGRLIEGGWPGTVSEARHRLMVCLAPPPSPYRIAAN